MEEETPEEFSGEVRLWRTPEEREKAWKLLTWGWKSEKEKIETLKEEMDKIKDRQEEIRDMFDGEVERLWRAVDQLQKVGIR